MNAITPTISPNGRHDHDPAALGELTPTGWTPPERLTYDQWVNIGRTIGDISNSTNWWVGDWLLTGERKWGSRYLQAVHVLNWSEQRLMDAASVAKRVPPGQRNQALSWSHHKAVTRYAEQPEVQREWLETAESNGLSVAEFREEIRVANGDPMPKNPCIECQEWLGAIRNAELCIELAIENGWDEAGKYAYDSDRHLAAAVWLSKRFNYMSIRTGEEL